MGALVGYLTASARHRCPYHPIGTQSLVLWTSSDIKGVTSLMSKTLWNAMESSCGLLPLIQLLTIEVVRAGETNSSLLRAAEDLHMQRNGGSGWRATSPLALPSFWWPHSMIIPRV